MTYHEVETRYLINLHQGKSCNNDEEVNVLVLASNSNVIGIFTDGGTCVHLEYIIIHTVEL